MPTTDLLARHRLDLDAIEKGRWVEVDGDQFLVASLRCTAVATARSEAVRQLGLGPDAEVPADKADQVNAHVFATALLRNIKFAADPDFAYQTSHGLTIWTDPELRDLRDKLLAAATGDFRKSATDKAAILGN